MGGEGSMRVGIIGGGFGTTVLAPIISMNPHMEVVAVSTMHLHQLPEEFAFWNNPPKHYNNWLKMLDNEKLDLLFISSAPPFHFEMVKRAILKKVPVVCEPPFTMNAKQVKELVHLSKEKKVKVIIDFEWRFLAIRQKMKELIQDGSIGKVLHYENHVSIPQYPYLQSMQLGWKGEKDKFGGMLGSVGSHMIDSLTWFLQENIKTIQGLLHTHIQDGAGEKRDADDAFFLHGTMQSNATFSLQFLSGVNHGFGSRINIFGTEGTISLINNNQLKLGQGSNPFEEVIPSKQLKIPQLLSNEASDFYPALYPFLEKVYDYIVLENLDKDLPLIEDGYRNQVILDWVRAP